MNSSKAANSKLFAYKKYLIYIKVLLMLFILWMLIHKAQLQLDLFYTVLSYPWSTFFIIALCYLMVIFHAWRWYRLNATQGIGLSFLQTIPPTYLGIAFNNVLPGSVGGDFVRLYYILKKFPTQKSAAVLSILIDRINGLMGIFVIACIIAPYYLDLFHHNHTLFYLLLACISFCLSAIMVFFLTIYLLSGQTRLAQWLTTKIKHTRWAQTFMALLAAIHIYSKAKLVILESLIVSMMTQGLLLIVVVILSKIMGLPPLSLFDYMLALVIGQIANLLPLTPGGIGVGEAAFANIILILHPGMSAAYATVFLALRILSTAAYLPGVIIGIFGFNLLHKQKLAPTLEA